MGTVETLRLLSRGWEIVRGRQAEPAQAEQAVAGSSSTWLATLGWISAGAGALGLGLILGRELRQRYKFQRRTPYDAYAHAGDYKGDLEFGVGI